MSQNHPILSQEAIEYLCGLIKITLDSTSILDDLNIRTDGTFSSHKIDNLLKLAIQDANEYSDSVTSALIKLTAEEMKEEPTLENTTDKINTLIVYSPTGDTNYNQYLRIQDKLIDFGSATIDFSTIYTKEQADNKFALKTDIDDIKTAIGDMTTLETVEKTNIVGAINELSDKTDEIANKSVIKTLTLAQHTELVTNGSIVIDGETIVYNENDYYIITDDTDNIDLTKFNIKMFSSLEQLGLTKGCTVSDIFLALPDNSIARLNCGGYNIDNIPEPYGILMIDKQSTWRFDIEFKAIGGNVYTENRKYLGILKGDDGTGLTWERVLVSKVSDVEKTEISFSSTYYTASGNNSWYMVKDGWATVHFCIDVNQPYHPTSSNLYYPMLNLPKPINDYYDSMVVWDNTGATLSFILYTDGKLFLLGGEAGMDYHITFSYQVAES